MVTKQVQGRVMPAAAFIIHVPGPSVVGLTLTFSGSFCEWEVAIYRTKRG